ncbi:MAG: MFS transporter, partial [Frankiaceae bacterium]|nr:MFS transporter [Frankiaceae bacterium]
MSSLEPVAVEANVRFRDVLGIQEFRALYAAQLLSVAGDQVARVAVAILVFNKTASTTLTGATYAASYLPWIVGGPVLAGISDRLPRRSVMIWCDVIRAILVLFLAIPGLPTWLVISLVALVALGEPPFASARSSLIPDLVGEGRKYAVASTLANTSSQLAVAVGFALGGLVVGAAGTTASLLIDAGTFGASALLAATYFQRRAPADPEPGSFLETITKGLVIVFRDPRLRWLAVSSWLLFGIGVSTEAAAVPYVRSHHGT